MTLHPPRNQNLKNSWGDPVELAIYDRRAEAARHPRLIAKGGESLVLDHYLEALMRKTGAMPGSAVPGQARAAGAFTLPTRRSGQRPAARSGNPPRPAS